MGAKWSQVGIQAVYAQAQPGDAIDKRSHKKGLGQVGRMPSRAVGVGPFSSVS